MELNLIPLKKYSKRGAKKKNNFKAINPSNSNIIINTNLFNINDTPDVYIANSKKEFKKAKKTNFELIYHTKKGLLYYNENGDSRQLGKGGVIAIFSRRQNLNVDFFKFTGHSTTSSSEPLLTLLPALAPTGLLLSVSRFARKIFPQIQLSRL